MTHKDALEFPRRFPAPRKLLQYAQRRWPIAVAKRMKRKAVKVLATICWQACRVAYRKLPTVAAKLGVEKVARRAWRVLHPWSEWTTEALTQVKHWDDVYAAYVIAYASMTVQDRVAMAHNGQAAANNEGLNNGCI